MKNYDEILKYELAQRILDIDPYGARDCDETLSTITARIENDPLSIINYLVEIVEDLQS